MDERKPASLGPREDDLEHPSAARMYDWYLAGTTNYAVDREFGKKILNVFPIVQPVAQANRYLLHRIVRHLLGRGIRQFVDLGSGIPTAGNVHQVAGEIAPDSRMVYVDYEPVAVAHSQILLDEHGDPARNAVVNADLRAPDEVWEHVLATGVIDPNEPIALLQIAVLHFVTGDGEAERALERYRALLPGGSYLAISHAIAAVLADCTRSAPPVGDACGAAMFAVIELFAMAGCRSLRVLQSSPSAGLKGHDVAVAAAAARKRRTCAGVRKTLRRACGA